MKYFDYAATTPMSGIALETYQKVANQYYANANSLHDLGGMTNELYELFMKQFSDLIGCQPEQLFLTSGGSESNILGIKTILQRHLGKHIIVSRGEHNSIHNICQQLEEEGYDISYLSFNTSGQIDIEELRSLIRNDTTLVIVQHANGEIGTLQPIEEIVELCHYHNIYFHMDAVQSFTKVDLKHMTSMVDSMSMSSHKVYGPKRLGGLYLKEGLNNGIESLLLKGNTLDVPGVASFVSAAYDMVEKMDVENERVLFLRNLFFDHLSEIKEDLTIYENNRGDQLPSIIGMGIQGIEGQWVMLECNRNGFAISTGSACDVKYNKKPNALNAQSVSNEKAREFFRISMGKDTMEEDVIELAQFLVSMVKEFKGGQGLYESKNVSR
ncbi:IscS subfamily cysteine desulfurase [Piscibacillus sp. B03]|uniref:IscS subfamily cysteine desulfurase n=1 Tax=Piscibacillus sp. B03 TaxID=3457430 RepID=UPI003FCE55DB